ncbi:MAG: hypothetical protein ABSF00_01700 [Candidatus Bathyarchaeia archaeon]|jgi:predicted RNase H-like HicB family nuclease
MLEDNGTYAMARSTLGGYSVGTTLKDARQNFERAVDLHLAILREKSTKELDRSVTRITKEGP